MESREQIESLALRVFGDEEKAGSWLSSPKRIFDGKSALQLLETEAGFFRVKEALIQIDEGYF